MGKTFALTVLLVALMSIGHSAIAQTVTSGKIVILSADPGDFVVELDTGGSCGSKYFHIQRANANFREMTAIAMTAFTTGKTLTVFVVSCAGNRNIISHGYVSR